MRTPMKQRLAVGAGIFVLLLLPQLVQERYFLHIAVMAGIYTILTLSWNLLAGYTGQLNLGHAAFFGIGAYTSALVAIKLGISAWFGLLAGGLLPLPAAIRPLFGDYHHRVCGDSQTGGHQLGRLDARLLGTLRGSVAFPHSLGNLDHQGLL